jgi:hypothetical protein
MTLNTHIYAATIKMLMALGRSCSRSLVANGIMRRIAPGRLSEIFGSVALKRSLVD